MNIILGILLIISICISIYCAKNKIQVDNQTKEINKNILAENEVLNDKNKFLKLEAKEASREIQRLQDNLFNKQNEFDRLSENVKRYSESQKELSQKAYENYMQVLENKYKEVDNEYEKNIINLQNIYSNRQIELIKKEDKMRESIQSTLSELEEIKASRDAAIEAARRERLAEAHPEEYCIKLNNSEKVDIERMIAFAKTLNNPRPLYMSIYTSLIRTPLKNLCDKTFGNEEVCGIYKLTVDKEVYIGQSVRCKERMTEHFKKALGIDAPSTSKLYNFLQTQNIWDIQIELLEKCPKEQLDEKERMYINLYQANSSLNSTKGNS